MNGTEIARQHMRNQVVRMAREFRNMTRTTYFGDDPDAAEAWDALNEAITALDDWSARQLQADIAQQSEREGRGTK